jgi:hypothetical protein
VNNPLDFQRDSDMIICGCFLTIEGYMKKETCHYVRVDIDPTTHKRVVYYVQEFFDLNEYLEAQKEWVKNDLLTHHGVRVKMGWSEERLLEELQKQPDLLINHFIEYKGHDWYRDNIRPRFFKTQTQTLNNANILCLTAEPEEFCGECDICLVVHKVQPVKLNPVKRLARAIWRVIRYRPYLLVSRA